MTTLLMKKLVKTIFCLSVTVWMGNLSVSAQLNTVTKSVTEAQRAAATALRSSLRTFEQGLRMGGLFYVTPSVTIGHEILRPVGTSVVGGTAQQRYLNTLRITQGLGASISRQLARQLSGIEEPGGFPGFTVLFPEKWKQFLKSSKMKIGSLSVVLDAAFGHGSLGDGNFVASFEEVRRLSVTPVESPVSFEQAMKDALEQSKKVKNGFFVIRVAGNDRRPQDTLVLDISYSGTDKPFRWISVNRSRDKARKATLAGNDIEQSQLPK